MHNGRDQNKNNNNNKQQKMGKSLTVLSVRLWLADGLSSPILVKSPKLLHWLRTKQKIKADHALGRGTKGTKQKMQLKKSIKENRRLPGFSR
jgi:ribosomal protein L39E